MLLVSVASQIPIEGIKLDKMEYAVAAFHPSSDESKAT